MNNSYIDILHRLDRREALTLLGGLGASVLIGSSATIPSQAQSTVSCVLTPDLTEGPYFVDEKLNRSDIRVDPSTGLARSGTPLQLTFNVYSVGSSCAPLTGAYVDVWHADAAGSYSDESALRTSGQKYLRGYQITDGNGTVRFTTIYPGWYMGRAVHIHFKIRTYSGNQLLGTFTSQFFFDDSITDAAYTQAPYSSRPNRDTRNSADGIYNQAGANISRLLMGPTLTSGGYSGTLNVGVNLPAGTAVTTASQILPQVAAGGGWQTSLLFSNTRDSQSSVQVNFLSTSGQPLTLPVSGIGSVSSSTVALAPRSTTALVLPNSGSLIQGWAEASLPDGVLGYALYRWLISGSPDQEALVPLSPQSSAGGVFVFDETAANTAYAVANPSTQAGTITAIAYQADGSSIGSATIAVDARSRVVGFFRNLAGLTGMNGTRGYVTLASSNGVLAALALRFGSLNFASIPIAYQ